MVKMHTRVFIIKNFKFNNNSSYEELFNFIKEKVEKGYWVTLGDKIIRNKNGLAQISKILKKGKTIHGSVLKAEKIEIDSNSNHLYEVGGKLVRGGDIQKVVFGKIQDIKICLT